MKASKAKEKAKVRVCVCVCVLFEEFGPVEGSTGVNASRTRVHDLWGKVAEWRRRGRGEEGWAGSEGEEPFYAGCSYPSDEILARWF